MGRPAKYAGTIDVRTSVIPVHYKRVPKIGVDGGAGYQQKCPRCKNWSPFLLISDSGIICAKCNNSGLKLA